jgi:hypothetical protein
MVESWNSASGSTLSRVCLDCDEELGGDVASTTSGEQEREGDIDATASGEDPRDIEEKTRHSKLLCISRAFMVATRVNWSRS